MYKNFNITESEKEQILNRLKENGYGQPINEQSGHGVGQMGDHINPEQDALDMWEKSKDLNDFQKLMMSKGYSDDESYDWMKKMIAKFGIGNHNVRPQPLKPATPVQSNNQNLNKPKIQVPQSSNTQPSNKSYFDPRTTSINEGQELLKDVFKKLMGNK